jgi:hypothetical protein
MRERERERRSVETDADPRTVLAEYRRRMRCGELIDINAVTFERIDARTYHKFFSFYVEQPALFPEPNVTASSN